MPVTLQEIIDALLGRKPQPPPNPNEGINAERPWDSPVLQTAPVQPQTVQPAAPAAAPATSPTDAAWTAAQGAVDRQDLVSKLTNPATPVLELPADLVNVLLLAQKNAQTGR